jgi:uncharacterized membrane protein YobD (UPF0266 family)
MFDILLLILVIVFLVFGLLGLLSFGKPCRNWKVVAKARVVSKIKYVSAVGIYLVVVLFFTAKMNVDKGFSDFDVAYLVAMAVVGILWIWNHSKAEIAEEGIIVGRIVKICIPWKRFKDVRVEGNSIKAGRYVLTVEEGLKDLDKVLKL